MNHHYFNRYLKLLLYAEKRKVSKKTKLESHHILPKCFGGHNRKSNIIKLTPHEHYKAHLFLSKACPKNRNLKAAVGAVKHRFISINK